jgi:catechol 2,3-dioxygenase
VSQHTYIIHDIIIKANYFTISTYLYIITYEKKVGGDLSKYHIGKISKWKKVYINVESLEVAASFYTTILGFKLYYESSDCVIVGDKFQELIEMKKAKKIYRNAEGQYHLAFLLDSDVLLASLLQHIIEQGYPIDGAADHGVSKAIYLKDPFGNGIEIYIDTDSSTWKKSNGQIEMVTNQLDIKQLLSFKQVFQGLEKVHIGHIHLRVKNIGNMVKFYSQFGLEETLNLRSALFTSFGGYHHHMAFNNWGTEHAEKFDSENIGLNKIDLELCHINTIKDSISNILRDNKTITMTDPIGITVQIIKGE